MTWHRFVVPNPHHSVPQFRGGPLAYWSDRLYGGEVAPSIADIACLQKAQHIHSVMGLMTGFPPVTTMIGIVVNNSVHIIDGMARAIAIAAASARGGAIKTDLHVCLAQWPKGKPLLIK